MEAALHESTPPAPARARRPRTTGRLRRQLRRFLRVGVLVGAPLSLLSLGPALWLVLSSASHQYTVDNAPTAPVVIVFGAQLAPDRTQPMPFLRGRLDVAADLVTAGKASAVLVSGDDRGTSGDEIAAMTNYLTAHVVPANRLVGDPHGLDSYDTCRRARDVYGVRRALLVSQSFHLARAVTLCRRLGIDAAGVAARCDGCQRITLVKNTVRELPAAWKAAYDVASDRPPAVSSPPDPAVSLAAPPA